MMIYGQTSQLQKFWRQSSDPNQQSIMLTAIRLSVVSTGPGKWFMVCLTKSTAFYINTHQADLTFNFNQMPFGVVANYYLVDVSPANGSTELWLASHRNTSFKDCRNCTEIPTDDFGIRADLLEERSRWAPPIQPIVKKGSVVLRDLRLWHAGLSNPSPNPRIMLAFVHTPWVSPTIFY